MIVPRDNLRQREEATRAIVQQKLLKSRHSNSILQMIRQIRFINEYDRQENKGIMLRAIISNKYQSNNRPVNEGEYLVLPKKALLFNKKDEMVKRLPRSQSIAVVAEPPSHLEIVPQTNSVRKAQIKLNKERRSLDNLLKKPSMNRTSAIPESLPSIERKSDMDPPKDYMSREYVAKQLQKQATHLSRWSDNTDNDETPY